MEQARSFVGILTVQLRGNRDLLNPWNAFAEASNTLSETGRRVGG
jgi:hypothetical protein